MEYKRLTKKDRYGHWYTNEPIHDRGMTSDDGVNFKKHYFENGLSAYDGLPIDRLAELEDKIEQGKMIECNPKMIGECVVGIHQHTDGTYSMDLDEENIVIGFCSDGIVTANTTHAYNDYFEHGLYFIDSEEGKAEAEKRLKELQNVK